MATTDASTSTPPKPLNKLSSTYLEILLMPLPNLEEFVGREECKGSFQNHQKCSKRFFLKKYDS